jgi:hypothetical protein
VTSFQNIKGKHKLDLKDRIKKYKKISKKTKKNKNLKVKVLIEISYIYIYKLKTYG